jgi:hypothetical protein
MKTGRSKVSLIAVLFALAVQVVVLLLSFEGLWRLSVFCAAANTPSYSWVGYLHVGFLVLLIVGLISIRLPRLRVVYLPLICLGLLALPLQARLLAEDKLHCDGP